MAERRTRRGWWRRNAPALLALPLVLIVIGLLGSYRYANFYAKYELTDPVRAPVGQSVALVQNWTDASGEHRREVALGADSAQVVTAYTGVSGQESAITPVEGTQVWRIRLHVQADPKQVLSGCRYAVVDQHGRVANGSGTGLGDQTVSMDYCVPDDTPGPQFDMGEQWEFAFDDDGASARPETYTVSLHVRLAQDAIPVELRVWWETPTYAALALPTLDAAVSGAP